jgi:hypothetical protein
MSASGGVERMPKFLVTIFPLWSAMLSVAQESKLSPEQEQVWRIVVEARDRTGYIAAGSVSKPRAGDLCGKRFGPG